MACAYINPRLLLAQVIHMSMYSVQTAKCCNSLTIHGYELNPTSAALAQANAAACNLDTTYQVRPDSLCPINHNRRVA